MIDFAALVSGRGSDLTSSSAATEEKNSAMATCCPDGAVDVDGTGITAPSVFSMPSVSSDATTEDHHVALLLRQIVQDGRDLVVDEHGRLTVSPFDPTIAASLDQLQDSLLSACAAAGVSYSRKLVMD